MKRILLILILALGMAACDDLFEKDLTDTQVYIIAPSDGLTIEPGDVSFLWREVEGATAYRIRIIGGGTGQAGLPVADTLMYNDSTGVRSSYKCKLAEGEYRWSVMAQNSVYETGESTYILHVVGPKPFDISGVEIAVTAPFDGAEVEAGEVAFSWKEVAGADYYHFTLVSPEFGSASKVIAETVLNIGDGAASNLYKVTVAEPGNYQWKVSAGNAMYETTAKVVSFHVPQSLPEDISASTVQVISPVDGSEAEPGEMTFLWQEVKGATSYHLTVVGPSFGGANTVIVDKVMDVGMGGSAPTSHTVDIPAGEYEWKITAENSHYYTAERIYTLSVVAPEEPVEPGPEDISGLTVQTVSPVDGVQTQPGEVTFLWKEVKGADSYHLTVVGPSFGKANTVVVDRVMEVPQGGAAPTSHTANIPQGEYEWKITASNSLYQTREHIYSFTVYAPSGVVDISKETISVIAPYNGAVLDAGEVTFLWREVQGATSYHITVVGPSFTGAKVVIADEETTSRSFRANIPAGRYQWSLKAINEEYETVEQIFSFEVAEPKIVP